MVTINQKETRAQQLSSRLIVISKHDCDLLLEISKIEHQANTPEDFELLEEKIKTFKSRFVLSEDGWENGVDSNEELLERETGELFVLDEIEEKSYSLNDIEDTDLNVQGGNTIESYKKEINYHKYQSNIDNNIYHLKMVYYFQGRLDELIVNQKNRVEVIDTLGKGIDDYTYEFKTIEQLINEKDNFISAIPNYMGINLCSVNGIEYTRQGDSQLVSMKVIFEPIKSTESSLDKVLERYPELVNPNKYSLKEIFEKLKTGRTSGEQVYLDNLIEELTKIGYK